jgi:hypothetical protein
MKTSRVLRAENRRREVEARRASRRINLATVPHAIGTRAKYRFLAAIRESIGDKLAAVERRHALLEGASTYFNAAERGTRAGGEGIAPYAIGHESLPAAWRGTAEVAASGNAESNIGGGE